METSIRFLRIGTEPVKAALCFRGKKRCCAVINTQSVVRVISNISPKDHDLAYPVTFHHGPYPIPKIVEHFREIGARKGITQRADYFLDATLNGGIKEEEATIWPPDTVAGAPEAPPEEPVRPVRSGEPRTSAPKPAKPLSGLAAQPSGPSRTAGADVIRKLAAELKLDPSKLRKFLRAKGLKAPYDDEKKIREVLK